MITGYFYGYFYGITDSIDGVSLVLVTDKGPVLVTVSLVPHRDGRSDHEPLLLKQYLHPCLRLGPN